VVAFDVTETRRLAGELDRFFRLSQDLLCIATTDGTLVRLNPKWSDVLGYPVEELIGHKIDEFVHPDDRAATLAAMNGLECQPEHAEFSNRLRRQDGAYRILEWHACAVDGVIHFVGRDVTARRQAEERLRDLSRAIEQSPAIVIITDIQGNIEYVNPKFEAVTGYSRDEVIGKNPRLLKSGKVPPAVYRQLWRTILSGETWEGEFENRRKDGSLYHERAIISPVRDEHGKVRHFVAVKEDVTTQRELQAQLFQAQKMEAIGLLAGGVAHDFNNLLTIINGHTELLLESPELPDVARKQLSTVLEAGRQAASLTRQLLLFGRQQPGSPVVVDLNHLLTHLEDFYRRVLPENITLSIHPPSQPAFVVADPTLLQQVLMNLVLNARDAMPDGGALRIGLKHVQTTPPTGEQSPEAGALPGAYLQIEVADSGCGMTEDVLQHVFEPFFTTKPVGYGTGLGLATAFGIVKQMGGWIRAQSRPGEGSTFSIYLPDAGVPAVVKQPAGDVDAPPSGVGCILLVEDAREVLDFTAEALRNLGYTVLEASTPAEALELAHQHGSAIELIVSDVLLPGTDGPRLVRSLRTVCPTASVLFVSGYASSSLNPAILDELDARYLPKPFELAKLARAVHESFLERHRGCRVLVVDDEPAIRELLETMLSDAGYEVLAAADGREALRLLKSESVDLILLDLVMPNSEGIETLSELRRGGLQTPVIAMSGAFGGQFLAVARHLGAKATLPKPISRLTLLRTVKQVLTTSSCAPPATCAPIE
jgi:PAS domain S-box-containing protein